MDHKVRLILWLHNHQPIGNFDGVFEQAFQDSYQPFLDVLDRYESLKLALHVSGPLMEWLDVHHPDYVDRLAALAASERVEIIGGAFYEPILTMIPSQDRLGQITEYTRWLEERLNTRVRGMWIAERVWEQSLAQDISRAGIEYTMLDDFHFKNAGLADDRLHGYYTTEDHGRLLSVFPGSERMRYLIPFADPQESIDHLRLIAQNDHSRDPVVVFGDDGEKFGTWPETKKHVYDDGWLVRFLDLLVANSDWIQVTTPSETIDNVAPLGKIYLPETSYREMTEWAMPVQQQLEFENVRQQMKDDPRWPTITRFVRGGFWRNFRVKYSEANDMYARMMMVSDRLQEATSQGSSPEWVKQARRELFRGQCNCAYWHGAFGGIYLPHLRNAIYRHLIAADNLLDRALAKPATWIEASAADYNLDSRTEVRLASDQFVALIAPADGGQLVELDVRSICHNLLATLMRRPEAYHKTVLKGAEDHENEAASIHDRVIFKQEGLDQHLQCDTSPRKSLIDHFYDTEATLNAVASGSAAEYGDFIDSPFEARLRRNPNRIQVQLTRTGQAFDQPLKITKGITMQAGSHCIEIAYLLEGLPRDRPFHFAVELNFAGLPAGEDDRYFYQQAGNRRLGHLGSRLDLDDGSELGMVDEWLGIDLQLSVNRPTRLWAFPIETVSQSEGGFELIHQSIVVQPHWLVQGDADGSWSASMNLVVDTSAAENRADSTAEVVASQGS